MSLSPANLLEVLRDLLAEKQELELELDRRRREVAGLRSTLAALTGLPYGETQWPGGWEIRDG